MDMKNRPARLGFVAALLALLLGPLVFGAQTALAHPDQATYYGEDQEPGTIITASIDGETCGSSDTDDEGVWVIHIDEGDCGGNAAEGATVNFHIGDALAAESVTWTAGDLQALALTVAPEPEPAPEPDDGMDGMDDGADDGMDGMDDGADDGMDDMDDGADDGMDGMDDGAADGMDGMDDGADDGMDGMDDDADDAMDDDKMDDDKMGTPEEPDTGSAGFATGSGSSSMVLVLALGVLAVAGVAGARKVTGRID